MRIWLPATRSPSCLDAGSRGFAKLEDPGERFPYSRMSGGQRRLCGELSRRVNYMAASATAPDRVPASGLFRILDAFPAPGLGKGDPGPSRSPVSVIGHCQRRFLRGDFGRPGSGACGQGRARDARPEGRDPQPLPPRHAQRSEHGHEAARLLARQGSPVAQRCANDVAAATTGTINPQEIATTRQHVSVSFPAAAKVASPQTNLRGQQGKKRGSRGQAEGRRPSEQRGPVRLGEPSRGKRSEHAARPGPAGDARSASRPGGGRRGARAGRSREATITARSASDGRRGALRRRLDLRSGRRKGVVPVMFPCDRSVHDRKNRPTEVAEGACLRRRHGAAQEPEALAEEALAGRSRPVQGAGIGDRGSSGALRNALHRPDRRNGPEDTGSFRVRTQPRRRGMKGVPAASKGRRSSGGAGARARCAAGQFVHPGPVRGERSDDRGPAVSDCGKAPQEPPAERAADFPVRSRRPRRGKRQRARGTARPPCQREPRPGAVPEEREPGRGFRHHPSGSDRAKR